MQLSPLVRESESMIHRLLGDEIKIEIQLAEEAGTVLAEPGQLDQVLMNLVVNVRDAMS